MESIRFEWDSAKSKANLVKHNVSFEEARSVFYDENALLIDDPNHSDAEERFVIMGIGKRLRLLVVCHCYRTGNVIRIISARKATASEATHYGE
jgi:uncharacterized DUF497 family protein